MNVHPPLEMYKYPNLLLTSSNFGLRDLVIGALLFSTKMLHSFPTPSIYYIFFTSVSILLLYPTATVSLPSVGDTLGLWTCTLFPDRQMYDYIPTNNPSNPSLVMHMIVHGTENDNPPLVWDIAGPSNSSGTSIHVWGSYTPIHTNQQWIFVPVPSTSYIQLQSVYDINNCVGVESPGGIGASVNIYPCNATDSLQYFLYDNTQNILQWGNDNSLCIQAGNNTPSCDMVPFNTYPYCNSSLPVEDRLDDLLKRMTLSEKIMAMDSSVPSIPRLGIGSMHSGEALHGAATGCLSNPVPGSTGCPTSFPCPLGLSATFDTDLWANIGKVIGTESRALYNQNIGSLWVFAPNINSAVNPNWGRNQEVPGEDVTIVTSYAKYFIGGLQGYYSSTTTTTTNTSIRNNNIFFSSNVSSSSSSSDYLLVASTAKHAFVYSLEGYIPRIDPTPRPVSGTCDTPSGCQRWNYDAYPPSTDLQNYYMVPFQTAVNIGVRSIMCAYNAVYGAPACGSSLVNTELRGVLEWDGHLVSDCTAIELMGDAKYDNCNPPYPPINCIPDWFPGHNFVSGPLNTANAALEAGVDNNCGPFYRMWLDYFVENGNVTEQAIDLAVRRIYRSAIKLGMLDPLANQPYAQYGPEVVDTPVHRNIALQAASESIVLLKNTANLLPLTNPSNLKLAFIGPHANSTQSFLSSYHGDNTLVDSHSPLQVGLSMGLNINYSLGCNICDVIPPGFPNMPCTQASDTSHISAAVQAAQMADIAIVFVGSDQTTEAENFDRNNITLAGVQEQLVLAILQAQPRTIVLFISGGIVSSPMIISTASTVLQVFYPGELGGDAIIQTLIGTNIPSGKLPVTMYYPNVTINRDIRTSDLSAQGGITHNYFTGPVLYPFGYGISYTSFTYDAVWSPSSGYTRSSNLLRKSVHAWEPFLDTHGKEINPSSSVYNVDIELNIDLTITNTGKYAADDVIMTFIKPSEASEAIVSSNYTSERYYSLPRPRQTLVHFTRVRNLSVGETRQISLTIPLYDHRLRSALGQYMIDTAAASTSGSQDEKQGFWIIPQQQYTVEIGDVTRPARLSLVTTDDALD